MDKRTEFVDSLKVDVPNEEELLKNLLDKKYEEYAKIYENKKIQERRKTVNEYYYKEFNNYIN